MVGLALFCATALAAAAGAQEVPIKLIRPLPPPPLPCNGPDLAAALTSVKAENFNGQWWVVSRGKVTNVGTKDYDGKPGQANVQLIHKKLWDPAKPGVMTAQNVLHVAKGAFMSVQGSFMLPDYLRAGCASPLGQNECCREVQMTFKIGFDPDIRGDGNPNNDDCNPNNDTTPDTAASRLKYTVPCIKMR